MAELAHFSESKTLGLATSLESKYRLLHALGAGSGGQVHKALQLSTGQAVAIKVLDVADFEASVAARRIERFRREITICSTLYHPDIVRLVDSGELDAGTHYAVFEYIPGTTLAELLREEGMLTVSRAKRLMTQLLAPLAYAHANGIAHRDLKPSNVMVMSDGVSERVKILDFGISVATEQRELTRLTLSHEWVGTPAYAAPEQLRGEAANAKSDLYAWGLMFLECLTGEAAIRGKWLADIIEQQLQPLPHKLPEQLARHRLGGLLSRVLEKDPTRRPRDSTMLLSMLERVSTDDLGDQRGYLRDAHSAQPASPRLTDTLTDGKMDVRIERHRATVLCAKVSLVGSNTGVDVAQVDQLLEDANALVAEVLEQYGARSAQSLGGYSLVYFGSGQARDSDARVPMRASLELANRFEKTPRWLAERGLFLRVQIGIHHGPVLVRVFREARQQVSGLTARIAIELADMARDGDGANGRILVGESFRQLVVRHAEFAAAREYSSCVPWSQEPVRGYSLSGESRSASLNTVASQLVGRDAELTQLWGAWHARAEAGVATLLRGEPGIGKSRLCAELRQRVEQHGVTWIEARCLPEWQNAFLRPLANLFTQLFGLSGINPSEAGGRLIQVLAELGMEATDTLALFCVWLSLPLPEGHVPLTWSPQKQRQLLHQRIAETLILHMRRGAVLLIEDLHWADPSTLECVDLLLNLVEKNSCFVLLTSRPGAGRAWSVAPREIALNRLDEASSRTLAAILLQHDDPSIAEIAERSDGIPLYLEELALTLRGFLADGSASTEAGRVGRPGPVIPASLRDLLTSRLDGVGNARKMAEFAAAIGREFSFELLTALSGEDEFRLLGDIEQLVSAEVLVKRMRVDGPVYSFRHALIRDAAYDDMPTDECASAHRRIAAGLESHFPHLVESEPDIVAHHWEHAKNPEQAVRYFHIAAQRSRLASAHQEALDQLDRALALLQRLPESAERRASEAELLLTRGATVLAKRGYTAPEVESHFERVLSLLPQDAEATEPAFAARWGLWYFHNTRANLDRAGELALQLRASADGTRNLRMSVSAWEAICETRFYLGDLPGAVQASRICEQEYDFDQHRQLASLRGDDPHLASLSFEAIAEMARGRIASGLRRVEQALAHAERLSYPTMKAAMHCQAARVFMIWGTSGALCANVTRARAHTSEALRVSVEQGYLFWDAYARVIDASAVIADGDASAMQILRDASDRWNSLGARLGRCWHLSFVSEALRQQGQFEAAAAALDEALEFCGSSRSRFFEPEVRRRRAELLLDPRNNAFNRHAAHDEYTRASLAAERCGAHWWSLAIAVSKARKGAFPGDQCRSELRQSLERCELGDALDPPLVEEARGLLGAR
jgi:TOMM system kinase/cyclase fusion protein